MKQIERALLSMRKITILSGSQQKWVDEIAHYRDLTLRVINQTVRRVINKENVPSSEKIVSLFESHTDIIVKGFRDIRYGHKINLSTEKNGFITYLKIENGNPSDKSIFMPVLDTHQLLF